MVSAAGNVLPFAEDEDEEIVDGDGNVIGTTASPYLSDDDRCAMEAGDYVEPGTGPGAGTVTSTTSKPGTGAGVGSTRNPGTGTTPKPVHPALIPTGEFIKI